MRIDYPVTLIITRGMMHFAEDIAISKFPGHPLFAYNQMDLKELVWQSHDMSRYI